MTLFPRSYVIRLFGEHIRHWRQRLTQAMEASSSNDEQQDLAHEEGSNDDKTKYFHLFNCDRTYNLDSVEKLLKSIETKIGFVITPVQCYFDLWKMSETCDSINSQPRIDCAIFVVHAHESRLSINEDNAGIGYAKIYRALLKKTGEKVVVVIGGDDNYKNTTEEQSSVLSRWAYRMVSSQFDEEFLDGTKSFIFSWGDRHRPIHEEAMLHFLNPGKKEKFVPEPVTVHTRSQMDPKKEVKASKRIRTDSTDMTEERVPTEINTKTLDDLTIRTEQEKSQEPHGDSFQPDEKESDSLEGGSYDSFVNITHDDVSSVEDRSAESSRGLLQHQQAMDEDTSPRMNLAIYYQDPSDIDFLRDMIGDIGLDVVTSNDLSSFRELLSIHRIGTCFIVLKAEDIKNELLQKPLASRYLDLLREVKRSVESKAVVILHGSDMVSHCEEDKITAKIEEVLNETGVVLWRKSFLTAKRARFSRSKSCPNYEEGKTSTNMGYRLQAQPPSDTKDSTLVLQTRLHHGNISYEEKDVMHRLEGWTAPEKMGEELMSKWSSTADAQLEIWRHTNTGNYYIIVKEDNGTLVRQIWELARSYRPQFMNQLTNPVGASPPEDVLNLD